MLKRFMSALMDNCYTASPYNFYNHNQWYWCCYQTHYKQQCEGNKYIFHTCRYNQCMRKRHSSLVACATEIQTIKVTGYLLLLHQ